MFDFVPEKATAMAASVDNLAFFLLIVSLAFTLLVMVLVLGFGVRYHASKARRQPTRRTHRGLEVTWIAGLTALLLIIFKWGADLYLRAYAEDNATYEVFAIGKQWMWKFQHPSGVRELNELHLPVDEKIKITLISQDVIHSWYVPAFRLKHDVLPLRYSNLWFLPNKVGKYSLFCAEYCGLAHAAMRGRVVVLAKTDFDTWLATGEAAGTPLAKGEVLLAELGCRACHSKEDSQTAPRLEGIYGTTVQLSDGREVLADENYIRDAILFPEKDVVRNFLPVMPPYEGRVSESDIVAIISYIKSTRPEDDTSRQ